MRKLVLLFALPLGLAHAADKPFTADAIPTQPGAAETPPVADAIPAAVAALGAPLPYEFKGGIQMAVSAADAETQASVLQGLNHFHGGWDFEAARHFAAAMRRDPDCLMAHWGMVMALLSPTPETAKARNAAAERMLTLIDRQKGSKLERGYAYGLIKYLEEGPSAAAVAFSKVADEFPNDVQARLFAALFGRTGYDDNGNATPNQVQSEKILAQLVKDHPDSLAARCAWVVSRTEAPDLNPLLEPARAICADMPGYPPFHHLLGHCEWRTGNHRAAALAFGRASSLYENWLRSNKATLADCPEWAKAESYRVVALASMGDFDTAQAAAESLAATPLVPKRGRSEGVRMLLWETKTLAARLYMARDEKGDAARALKSLPKPDELKPYHDQCLAFWWIDALRLVLEAQRLAEAGDLEEARKVQGVLSAHGERMAKAQAVSLETGERSAWLRAFRALETLAMDTRAKITLIGPENLRGGAMTWFHSAADSQRRAVMLMPPVLLAPELARAGHCELRFNKPEEARDTFLEALKLYPNDAGALAGLQQAYTALNQPAEAAKVAEQIKQLRSR